MSLLNQQKICLDITRCDLDRDGVKPFWWPLGAEETRSFSDDMMRLYTATLASHAKKSEDIFHAYRLIAKNFVSEVVAVFQSETLFQKATEKNIELIVDETTQYWPLRKKRKNYNPDNILRPLRKGPQKTNILKRIINPKRSFKILKSLFHNSSKAGPSLSFNGLKIGPLTPDILKNHIISTERYDFLSQHAQNTSKDVYFCRSHKWFRPVSKKEKEKSCSHSQKQFETDLLNGIEELFIKNKTDLTPAVKKYIHRVLVHGSAIMRVHYDRLVNNPDALPAELWTGTGGNIWDTCLRLAVRRWGGRVYGHDHATGSGHLKKVSTGFVELWACDAFYTFNAAKADGIRKHFDFMPYLENEIPEISFLPQAKAPLIKKISDNNEIKTIVLMCPPFDRDRGRLNPIMPDIVRLDWICRLSRFLTDEGYQVILKCHPESRVFPPAQFESVSGAKITTQPYEQMMENADLVIFDHITTSTFQATLKTNLPILIFDSVDFGLTKEARDLLSRRVEFLNMSYDNENRSEVNWKAIPRSIKEASRKKNDGVFAETFLSR
jgi:hypothetical protein